MWGRIEHYTSKINITIIVSDILTPNVCIVSGNRRTVTSHTRHLINTVGAPSTERGEERERKGGRKGERKEQPNVHIELYDMLHTHQRLALKSTSLWTEAAN